MRKFSRKVSKKLIKTPRKVKKVLKKAALKFKPRKVLKNIRKFIKNKHLEDPVALKPIERPANNAPQFFQNSEASFPSFYHENKAALLVRDPWWIFAYWEVTPEREREVYGEIARAGLTPEKTVLRVYDVTDAVSNGHKSSFFDIELNFPVNNWYIDVEKPDRQWAAEIGIRTHGGRFFMLVRSNTVRTPRYGVSDILDEEWMLPDELYWKIFGLSCGFGKQRSSADVKEILERYLKNIASSENSPRLSPGLKP